jgi:hypothetical protein
LFLLILHGSFPMGVELMGSVDKGVSSHSTSLKTSTTLVGIRSSGSTGLGTG